MIINFNFQRANIFNNIYSATNNNDTFGPHTMPVKMYTKNTRQYFELSNAVHFHNNPRARCHIFRKNFKFVLFCGRYLLTNSHMRVAIVSTKINSPEYSILGFFT